MIRTTLAVVKTPCSHCRDHGFDPGRGPKMLQAGLYRQKKKCKKKKKWGNQYVYVITVKTKMITGLCISVIHLIFNMTLFLQNCNSEYMCRKNYERIYTEILISDNLWIIWYIMFNITFCDDGNVLYLHLNSRCM